MDHACGELRLIQPAVKCSVFHMVDQNLQNQEKFYSVLYDAEQQNDAQFLKGTISKS